MAAVWNMFDGAVRVLVGVGPIKQRLIEAWRDHLATLQEKDVPEALRPRLATLRHAMNMSRPTGGLSVAEVSVRKMSEKEAADHAVRILEIYGQLDASDADTTAVACGTSTGAWRVSRVRPRRSTTVATPASARATPATPVTTVTGARSPTVRSSAAPGSESSCGR